MKETINALTQSGKKEADPRMALRKGLSELRDLLAANKKGKQSKIDKLNTLNASLKTKVNVLFTSHLERMGFNVSYLSIVSLHL